MQSSFPQQNGKQSSKSLTRSRMLSHSAINETKRKVGSNPAKSEESWEYPTRRGKRIATSAKFPSANLAVKFTSNALISTPSSNLTSSVKEEVAMDKDLIKGIMQSATYILKSGTKCSYYLASGCCNFPARIDVSTGNIFSKVENKGRMTSENAIGEIRGQFKQSETSPLKQHPPFKISSKIFLHEQYPHFIGFATIGISEEDGKIGKDKGIAILQQMTEDVVRIIYFQGLLALPEYIAQAFECASEV